MVHTLFVDVEKTVVERFKVEVEADDREEAQDLVYHEFTEPENDFILARKLKIKEDVQSLNVLGIEFEKERSVQDEVFNDDGPEIA